MRVAHIIKSFNRGGAEVLLRETLEADKDYFIDLIILNNKAISLLSDLSNHNNVYLFNLFSYKFPIELIKLIKLLIEQKYDVLHTHLPLAGFIIRIIKPFFKSFSKLIYTEHNLVAHYNPITRFLNGITYHFNDSVVFVSEETKKTVEEYRRKYFYSYKSGYVVLNGVNTDKFQNSKEPSNQITVGTIASFRKQKRLDNWLEVVRFFKHQYPDKQVKFVLAGDGEEMASLKAIIKKFNLYDMVQTTGMVVDTVAIYRKIDIFMMTSDFEGLPVALLEGMSCSCVPIVTNVGGIKQMEFDGFGMKSDKFVVSSFCERIAHYADNLNKLYSEGQKAREYIISNFSIQKQLKELNEIYKHRIEADKQQLNTKQV